MKRMAALLTAAIMMIATVCVSAENAESDLTVQLEGQRFEFSSGVGGWGTELIMGKDGSFTGSYHDSEMGETGEEYPDGSVYGCTFHGTISDLTPVDE